MKWMASTSVIWAVALLLNLPAAAATGGVTFESTDGVVLHADIGGVTFESTDGVVLHADIYKTADSGDAPVVLLFHQAGGDARGEYERIIPRLLEAGYNVMSTDLRSGGDRFGTLNRTVAALEGRQFDYCAVYPDLEATLKAAHKFNLKGPTAIWGSSYSAALVFQLAARHPEQINAVLAFSPAAGGPMADCSPAKYTSKLRAPALALRPQREYDIDSVKQQLDEMAAGGIQTYVADPGVHGSSMLDAERVGESTDETWKIVLDFLTLALTANDN